MNWARAVFISTLAAASSLRVGDNPIITISALGAFIFEKRFDFVEAFEKNDIPRVFRGSVSLLENSSELGPLLPNAGVIGVKEEPRRCS
jgi:hypothetical protein